MATRMSRGVGGGLRRGGRSLRAVVVMLAMAAAVAGCAPGGGGLVVTSIPPGTLAPGSTVGPAVAATRAELVRVLGGRNLVLQDTDAPFRPPEDTRFTTTPRQVFQVILPDAPSEGFIVVYEFPDATTAAEAAADQAAYLASGPVRVQSAFGTRHVLRLVGSTVVAYTWVPEGSQDEREPEIQAALETLGVGVPIPS